MTIPRNQADLEALIRDGIEESASLEYKSGQALGRGEKEKQELTKDVSAFANAGGGVLIYGIAEAGGRDTPAKPEKIYPVDSSKFSKEWLDQMIGQIRPPVPGLEILSIYVGPLATDHAYVVIVPQGSTAHQALDHRYYRRRNFQSTSMEDYEIRDVMGRTIYPTLDASFQVKLDSFNDYEGRLAIRLQNVGTVMARHYSVELQLPLDDHNGRTLEPENAIIHGFDGEELSYISIRYTNDGGTPLFPGDEKVFKQALGHEDHGLEWEHLAPSIRTAKIIVYADNMPRLELVKDFRAAYSDWV